MKIVTNSAIRAYRTCARLYYMSYVLGYRPVTVATALSFGRLIHEALEAWWRMDGLSDRLEIALAVLQSTDGIDESQLVKAEEIIRGYHYRWIDTQYETIAVESTFEADLINPETGSASRTYRLGGKVDAIIRAGDDVWICEHKTSSEDITPGSIYWQKLRLDQQISTYFVGARTLGVEPVGCLYDVLGKPRIDRLRATPIDKRKYTKAGTLYVNQRAIDESLEEYRFRLRNDIANNPDRYYQRGEVVRLNSEEREAGFDVWQTTKMITDSTRLNRWPRNCASCFQYNRACDFWPVCSGETTLEDEIRYRHTDEVNEELSTNNKGVNVESSNEIGF